MRRQEVEQAFVIAVWHAEQLHQRAVIAATGGQRTPDQFARVMPRMLNIILAENALPH
jgi:hypothetical protein